MICIDCDTEITGKPVCRATRSAVRCRVPVSSEGIDGSGIRCTAACRMRVASLSSDDRAVHLGQLAQAGGGEGDVEEEAAGGDRVDGLVAAQHEQGAGAAAQDALEAVAQRRCRGRCCASVARSRSTSSVRSLLPRRSPRAACWRRPRGGQSRRIAHGCAARARQTAERRTSGLGAVHLEQRRAVLHAEVEHPQRGVDVGHADHLQAVDGADRAGVAVRLGRARSAPRKPEPGGLGQPLREVADPAQLAGQADLADRHQVGAGCRAASRPRRRAIATARSAAGSAMPDAADGGGEHVVGVQPDPRLAAGARPRSIATREPSSPDVVRRGRSAVAGVTSACTSARIGRRPSRRTLTQVPAHRLVVPGDEEPGGVGDRDDALAGQVEAADLVDRAEAVLHRPHHPEPGAALALEVQHHVDEVLEHPRAGDRCRPW